MRNDLLQRIVFAVLPALVILTVVASAVWGDNGLVVRHQMKKDLRAANADLAQIERENQRLLRELTISDRDPVVLERMVADELGWGHGDATLYRFDD